VSRGKQTVVEAVKVVKRTRRNDPDTGDGPCPGLYGDRMAQVGSRPAGRGRVRRHPANRRLLVAALLVLVGAFLPWIATGAGSVSGIRGAGIWTMYVAVLGLAGAAMRSHRLAGLHAAVLAVVALALPLWQVVHLLGLVGLAGWLPGPGLVMTVGGGVLAGGAALTLFRAPQSGAAPG
jgi:hypothetical protein